MPVVVASNKTDTRTSIKTTLDERLVSLISDFQPTIESIVESSARTLMNVTEIFSFAVRAALYPRLVLMDYPSEVCSRNFSVGVENRGHHGIWSYL